MAINNKNVFRVRYGRKGYFQVVFHSYFNGKLDSVHEVFRYTSCANARVFQQWIRLETLKKKKEYKHILVASSNCVVSNGIKRRSNRKLRVNPYRKLGAKPYYGGGL